MAKGPAGQVPVAPAIHTHGRQAGTFTRPVAFAARCLSVWSSAVDGRVGAIYDLSGCPVLSVAGQHKEHHRGQRKRPHQCTRVKKLRPGRQWPGSWPSGCQRHQSSACMSEERNPYGRLATVRSPCGRRGPFQVARSGCSLWRMAQSTCWEGSHSLPLFPSRICMHIPAHQVTRYLVGQGVEWWGCWG